MGGAIRFFVCGGAALDKSVGEGLKVLGLDVLEGYGMTEAAPMISFTRHDDICPGVSGKPLPGCDVEIREGEVCAKGRNIMKGYYKMPEATAQAIDSDGWLHSGDICMKTEDGYYKVTGRLKDMIIRGGENLYPVQIEDFLRRCDKIKDVAVIGLPDARLGEIAGAIIELKEGCTATEDEINAFCNELPRYKRPKKIIFDKK